VPPGEALDHPPTRDVFLFLRDELLLLVKLPLERHRALLALAHETIEEIDYLDSRAVGEARRERLSENAGASPGLTWA